MTMLPAEQPLVAIIGRANVGKSTLFNRLTRSSQALVADIPGVTRDRHYGSLTWDDHTVLLVDTGGLVLWFGGISSGGPLRLVVQRLEELHLFWREFPRRAGFFGEQYFDPLRGPCCGGFSGLEMGYNDAINQLKLGAYDLFSRHRWIGGYFWFCFKYTAPLLIGVVFLHALGLLR